LKYFEHRYFIYKVSGSQICRIRSGGVEPRSNTLKGIFYLFSPSKHSAYPKSINELIAKFRITPQNLEFRSYIKF